MKIEITPTGQGTKFMHNDGTEIKDFPVREVTVECGVDRATTAIMEVALVESVIVEPHVVEYQAPGFGRIKGLILEDGTLHYFPGHEDRP